MPIHSNTQLAYYNSGIGTHARPGWLSLAYLRQVILHKIDLAIAWNFESIILKGYRWLSDHYKPGDKIFLFGFSRGAYQVRVLAGMIATVGLIFPGNDEQIPFAYELYADLKHHKATPSNSDEDDSVSMTDRFKQTFSRESVKVHFVGVWDTVSSVGIIRGKNLPLTNENGHICYVRHALALDERRVKFLPEYVWPGGGASDTSASPKHHPRFTHLHPREEHGASRERDVQPDEMFRRTKMGGSERESSITDSHTVHLKEVWFLGTHSDIGGGNVPNKKLNNAAVPVLWMGNEALMAGLKLAPSAVEWNFKKLKENEPTPSMNLFYGFMELLPFRRLTYSSPNDTCWWPHMFRGRTIRPGQKIHASVAFAKGYKPKAKFLKSMAENMENITGKGEESDRLHCEWMDAVEGILEKDLFDHSAARGILVRFKDGEVNPNLSHRLKFMASSGEGGRAIIAADKNLDIVVGMLENNTVRADGCDILASLTRNELAPPDLVKNHAVLSAVSKMMEKGNVKESISASMLLRRFSTPFGHSMRIDHSIIMCLSRMIMRPDIEVRTNACKTLYSLSQKVTEWSVNPIDEEIARFLETQDPTAQIAGAWIVSKLSSTESALLLHPDIFDKLARMLQDNEPAVSSSGVYTLSTYVQHECALAALSASEAVNSIVTMLQSNDPQQHWACAELLKALSAREKVGIFISQRNIFPDIVKMLGAQDEDEVETATAILGTLAEDAECQASMIQANTIHNVIELFYQYPKATSTIQTNMIHNVIELFYQHSKEATSTDSTNATNATYATNATNATVVILSFAWHQSLRYAMIQDYIVPKLVEMLENIIIDKQHRALLVLKWFAIYEEFHAHMVDQDIISVVTAKLKKKTDPDITAAAVDALHVFSHEEIFRSNFSRKRVVSKVVNMFKKGRSSVVKIRAASFLQTISQYEELRHDVVPENVTPTLVEMLKKGHEKERLAAIELLTAFSDNESFRNLLKSESVLQAIIDMFNTGSAEENMSTANLLTIFAGDPDFRRVAVGRMDIIHISVANLSKDVSAKRRGAVEVLSALLDYGELPGEIKKEKIIPKLLAILDEKTSATRSIPGAEVEMETTCSTRSVPVAQVKSRMLSPELMPMSTNQSATVQETEEQALVRKTLKALAKDDEFCNMISSEVLESLNIEANGKVIQ